MVQELIRANDIVREAPISEENLNRIRQEQHQHPDQNPADLNGIDGDRLRDIRTWLELQIADFLPVKDKDKAIRFYCSGHSQWLSTKAKLSVPPRRDNTTPAGLRRITITTERGKERRKKRRYGYTQEQCERSPQDTIKSILDDTFSYIFDEELSFPDLTKNCENLC